MPNVPFFRPDLHDDEIDEVVDTLRSGWLTTGPKAKRFEASFAEAVGAPYAVAVNSCTAAMHLALAALELGPGQAVLVPTMTFAATGEVVRYFGAVPILVDCLPGTLNLDFEDAARKLEALASGAFEDRLGAGLRPVGMLPVHVGGDLIDGDRVASFAAAHDLWVVEDAAHAFPAAWRPTADAAWRRCGSGPSAATCFSFYANKTITTGEGGMLVTGDEELATRARSLSLHGLSHDAWGRYTSKGAWDYRILAPGFKYNLTDVAAAIGLHQLRRAEAMRVAREEIALRYREALGTIEELELPRFPDDRIHSWHLFPIRLHLGRLAIDRDAFLEGMRAQGIGFSVHWRPLHLHPYYQERFGWRADDLPRASAEWLRLVTLPLFPTMRDDEVEAVVGALKMLCRTHRLAPVGAPR